MVVFKPGNLLLPHKQFPSYKGSSEDSDQIFSYLRQVLRTVRTELFYKTFFMFACEIGTKTHDILLKKVNIRYNSQTSMFSIRFCAYILFQYAFN